LVAFEAVVVGDVAFPLLPDPESPTGTYTSAGLRATASLAVGVDENPFSIDSPEEYGAWGAAG
jgi:hypothetical protein